MDEILIDEKKYVSSKRAAKVTGYAKDYIGQLCREGRVPARLVGRSWYVLESAIHDHRFGTQRAEEEVKLPPTPVESHLKLQSTWESPRYEATTAEILPSINRLRNTDYKVSQTESVATENPQKPMLDGIDESHQDKTTDSIEQDDSMASIEAIGAQNAYTLEDEEGVDIPIHTLYELPPEDLLPRNMEEAPPVPKIGNTKRSGGLDIIRVALFILKSFAIIVAAISAFIAVLGTGYFDKFLASHNRATQLTGISTYIK